MTDLELDTGVEQAPGNDDLRSAILGSIAKVRGETSEAEPAVAAAVAGEGEAGAELKPDRARDEAGRFAEKAKEADAAKLAPKVAAQPQAGQEPAQPEPSAHKPPPGWSSASKAKFGELPAEIQADIAKRETEINQGFAKLADYKGIDRFVEQARNAGTNLETALTSYTSMEALLRKDPVRGVVEICRNIGIDPRLIGQALGGAPAQPQNGQATDPGAAPQVHPALIQELTSVKQTLAQFQQQQLASERNTLAQKVEAFFADPKNKFADQVSDTMTGLIKQARASGAPVDLDAIYGTAVWLHPEVREELIKERAAALNPPAPALNPVAKAAAAATQAKQVAKAVTGAPARNNPPAAAPPPNRSLREDLLSAIEAQKGIA